MQSRFERNEKASYLILSKEQDEKEDKIAEQMLFHNQIEGLLPVRIERMNGISEYYYDITSKHSLGSIIKKGELDKQKIINIINAIDQLLNQFNEYMLDAGGICLSEELIYLALPEWKIFFCYFNDGENFSKSIRKLLQYMIEYVDYHQKEAVTLAYECYQASMQEQFRFADVVNCLSNTQSITQDKEKEKNKVEQEQEKKSTDKEHIVLTVKPQIPSERFEEEAEESTFDEGKARKISILIFAVGIVVTGFLETAAFEGVFGEVPLWMIPFAGIFFTLIVFGVWCIRKKKWKEETKLVRKEKYYEFSRESEIPVQPSFEKNSGVEIKQEVKSESSMTQTIAVINESEKTESNQEEVYQKTVMLGYYCEEEKRMLFSCQATYPSIEITELPFRIGKMATVNQGVIANEIISRIHCCIEKNENGEYTITDTNSTNGVYIDGVRLKPNETTILPLKSEVVLGNLHYVFQ